VVDRLSFHLGNTVVVNMSLQRFAVHNFGTSVSVRAQERSAANCCLEGPRRAKFSGQPIKTAQRKTVSCELTTQIRFDIALRQPVEGTSAHQ
jgi:hypothetical protein